MKLKKTDFDFTTYKNKTDFNKVMEELGLIYSGSTVRLSDLTKGKDGKFSESALLSLINKMMRVYNFDQSDSEYMKNLLYVVIRSIETEVKGLLPQLGISYIEKTSLPDTLKTLKESFKPSGYAPYFFLSYDDIHKDIDIPIAFEVSTIACTLYAMFTGKVVSFPNPYEKEYIMECKKKGIKPFTEEPMEEDYDTFFNDFENLPYYASYGHCEEDIEPTPKKSRTINIKNYTFHNTVVTGSSDESTTKTLYHHIYPDLKDKTFKKDRDMMLLSFPQKDSFIEAFEYLITHNSASFCGIESCVPTMVEQLLLNYNVSLFSDVEYFGEAFYHLKRALLAAKEVTGKRYDR